MNKVNGPFQLADKMNSGGPIYKKPPAQKDETMENAEKVNTETITAEDVECDIDLQNQVADAETKTDIDPDEELKKEKMLELWKAKMFDELMRLRRRKSLSTKKKITPSMRKAKRTAQRKARKANR